MPKIQFLRPVDQPTNVQRLLPEIDACLHEASLAHFCLAVGSAKVGPLLRLSPAIQQWRASGKTVEGIFGINQKGTSLQALTMALSLFDKTYVTYVANRDWITFHPKLYLFYGTDRAVCFYGSHNLTVGGTETNFEGGVKVEFDRNDPADEVAFQGALDCWTSLLPNSCAATVPLDASALQAYQQAGLLLDESQLTAKQTSTKTAATPKGSAALPPHLAPNFPIRPPSSLPVETLPGVVQAAPRAKTPQAARVAAIPAKLRTASDQRLVIQIVPHHNGEIFLSKRALDQNQGFFEAPFTGKTVPKKTGNPSYPQRVPDPIVNIRVYDANGKPIPHLEILNFALNTVLYSTKSEIRVTVSPSLAHAITPYSVLVMTKLSGPQDYDMEVYLPGSQDFANYLAVCNQTLPSGGAQQPRKMGWL